MWNDCIFICRGKSVKARRSCPSQAPWRGIHIIVVVIIIIVIAIVVVVVLVILVEAAVKSWPKISTEVLKETAKRSPPLENLTELQFLKSWYLFSPAGTSKP